MSSGHPTNVTVYPHYKMFVFCAQLLLLPFSINSGLLFITNHHSLLPSLSWQEDAFLLPYLFSSVVLTCFVLSYVVLLPVVRKTFTQGKPGPAVVTSLDFPQGSPGPPGQGQ